MKFHYFTPFELVSIIAFILTLMHFRFRRKGSYGSRFYLSIAFLISCVIAVSLLKIGFIGKLFSSIISPTYYRRFFHYGLYTYLLIAFSLVYFLSEFTQSSIYQMKRSIIKKTSFGIGIILFLLCSIILYGYILKADRYEQSYIMIDNNVYTFIRRKIPTWSVICSYGYPALYVASQTPSYIVFGARTHLPPICGEDLARREEEMFHLASVDVPMGEYIDLMRKYGCNYLLLENGRDYYTTKYSSRRSVFFYKISWRRKISILMDAIVDIYHDDKYSFLSIVTDLDLNILKTVMKEKVDRMVSGERFLEGYELSNRYFSLLLTREKISILNEIFIELYRDDIYSLYLVKSDADLESIQKLIKKRIRVLLERRKILEAYEQSIKLLSIEDSDENYALNERIRNKLYYIDSERAILSGYFNGMEVSSNTRFTGFPHHMNMILDIKGFPDLIDEFYIAAIAEIKNSEEGQWIEVDFNTVRNIHYINIEWLDEDSRAIDFYVSYYINGVYRRALSVKNNESLSFTIRKRVPLRMSRLRITVKKAGLNRFILKSIRIL